MKHLLKNITLAAICLMAAIKASAYDFEENGIYYNILSETDKTCEVTYIKYLSISYSGDITIPEIANGYTVTAIGDYAFCRCSDLTSIEIPQGVTTIGYQVFYGCSGLTSIAIPQGVTTIGDYAFSGCSGLKSIKIPQEVTTIGGGAFSVCSGLTSIEIPQGVTTIGDEAFSGCSNLKEINVASNNQNYASYDGALYDKNLSALICCPGGKTTLSIPNGVTKIEDYAFYRCSGLTSIEIPQGVTSIGNNAFSSCSGLTSIEIPQGVTTIGNLAFSGCSNLKEINVASNNQNYASYDGALYDKNLSTLICCPGRKKSIEIPHGVTTIEEEALSECVEMTTVVLPKTLKEIGRNAFPARFMSSYLTSVTSLNPVPPVAASGAFGMTMRLPTLYVPAGSLEAYKNAEVWKDFPNIIELDPTGIEAAAADGQLNATATGDGIAVSGATGTVEVYTIGGALLTRTNATGGRTEIALPGRGLYIIKVGKQTIKVKR